MPKSVIPLKSRRSIQEMIGRPLLLACQVDRIFAYPRGRTLKLVRSGKLTPILLPDGEIRFDPDVIERIIKGEQTSDAPHEGQAVQHA